MADPTPEARARYRHFLPIPTRWMDNDVYGHVNNVVYYAYFDTVINRYLIDDGGLDILKDPAIGLCVESHCSYFKPLAFPDPEGHVAQRPHLHPGLAAATGQQACSRR